MQKWPVVPPPLVEKKLYQVVLVLLKGVRADHDLLVGIGKEEVAIRTKETDKRTSGSREGPHK